MADLIVPYFEIEDQQRFINQTDTEINTEVKSFVDLGGVFAFRIWYCRYQSLHLAKHGSYLLLSHPIYDNDNINNGIKTMDDEIFDF